MILIVVVVLYYIGNRCGEVVIVRVDLTGSLMVVGGYCVGFSDGGAIYHSSTW